MKKYAVIVAAGSGLRMGTSTPKQFLLLHDKPVLWYTLRAFLTAFDDLEIVLVLPKEYVDEGKLLAKSTGSPKRIKLVTGGETRFHSVKNGLALVPADAIVFVHDGVRCLITKELIHRCYNMALEKGNAVPAVSSVDSIRLEENGRNRIVDRNKIKIIQTPQTFQGNILKKAFEQDYRESFTDEASVVEQYGIKINLVEGEELNFKMTKALDILVAEQILKRKIL
ncbi:MAG TPA: 2-C-methyl-D-erythritol 4-phosphate cytidylyltransferase [Puia sp.]|nr:2-C-methyl-D-erythritol 4-phosphate cytidylyltransferase [Puia sp.]